MTGRQRLVVVGADAAGMSAAHQALRRAHASGRELEVIVLERTSHTSYSACGIPYWIAGDIDDPAALIARTADRHRELGVDLRLHTSAASIDLDRREVVASIAGQRSPLPLGFDDLVLATGARPVIPDWATTDGDRLVPGVLAVKTWDDGLAWLELLRGNGIAPRRAAVIGGGYIGVEMAEALVRRGLDVTLLTRRDVMPSLDEELSGRVRGALEEAGVEVRPGAAVEGLTCSAQGRVDGVVAGGDTVPADLVVLGLGVAPAAELGAAAGLAVGAAGGYLPDERQAVAQGVWAAGDCCESVHLLTAARAFQPLGTHANKQGRVAGENLAGGAARFAGLLGTAITRFVAGAVHVEIARTGLSSTQATAAGFAATSLLTEGRTASGYMPEAAPMATKLVADRASRRLLGAQIVGGPGAAKRIDTAAMAIWAGQSVDDVAQADLSYAPPFATVWEAVQLAARRLADRL